MSLHLKPLEDQVVVLTGATSGIGLATARLAAKRGARLVLAARSEDALRELADEINHAGGEAISVVCDVADESQVEQVRDAALDRFGGFDTWVNNAGVGMYGHVLDVPTDDARKLFETNFFGVFHGSRTAGRYFRDRGRADDRFDGTIVNIGSVLSYQPVPVQGVYSATKHAVKGLTDSLRLDLMHDKAPVSVTCIMPNAIDTPYAEHAANYTGVEATVPPPAYAPDTVARAILHAAQTPTRDLTVGGVFKPMTALNNVLPGVVDWIMSTFMAAAQKKADEPIGSAEPRALTHASSATSRGSMHEESGEGHYSMPVSAYTQARMHPVATTALLAGAGLLLAAAAGKARA
jgi:short-subunit dehydrogenase